MRRSALLALAAIVVVLGTFWWRTEPPPLNEYDQPFYLGIAFDLLHHGRFTDGYRFAGGNDRTERPPGMRFPPLYPALLAAAAAVDPPMRAATDCLVANGAAAACGRSAAPVRVLQFLLLVATCWLVWWQAGACTGDRRAGWLALALLLGSAPVLLRSVNTLMTETPALFLAVCAEAAALLAALRSGLGRVGVPILLSGVLAGSATLCRAALEPLGVLLLVVAVLASLRARLGGGGEPARSAWLFAPGFLLPLLPWMLRNAIGFGRFALTFGYASHTLVQRLSFDSMTGREWGLAWICWLPDGSGIGRALSGDPGACDRFGWDEHPDSFYSLGLGPMLDRTLRSAGGWDHHFSYLVQHFLLAHPLRQIGWHVAVTLPLAWRGLAIDHWWGMALGACTIAATVRALRRRTAADRRFLLLALPPLAGLLLNAAVAVNQPRYNLLLVLPFSTAGGMLLLALLSGRAAARIGTPVRRGASAVARAAAGTPPFRWSRRRRRRDGDGSAPSFLPAAGHSAAEAAAPATGTRAERSDASTM